MTQGKMRQMTKRKKRLMIEMMRRMSRNWDFCCCNWEQVKALSDYFSPGLLRVLKL